MNLTNTIAMHDGKYAFVAMPFASKFNDVYHVIKQACEKCKILPVRVDKLIGSRHIAFEINEGIQHCKYFIADLTPDISQEEVKFLHPDYVKLFRRSNPNVMYEIGYAEGLASEKEIILLIEQGSLECIPFDLQSKRCITYNIEELENLKNTLCKWLSLTPPTDPIPINLDAIDSDNSIALCTNFDRNKIGQTIDYLRRSYTDKHCNNLIQNLQQSNYIRINIQNYLWLIGWCNTAGAGKNVSLLAREVAKAMFNFVPKRYLDSGEDLKDYRYGAHKAISQKIIQSHTEQLRKNG